MKGPRHSQTALKLVLRGIVERRNNNSTTLNGTAIDGFHNRDHLVFVGERPVDLVVVSRSEIDHHMLISEEEHDRARVVQLVHGIEFRDLCDVHEIDDNKVLHKIGNLPECFILLESHPTVHQKHLQACTVCRYHDRNE